jgi:LuxR family transcriptional regulator, maltose regulon positive regulatory protein
VGWVSVDERDNGPAVLLTYIAVALDRVEPIDPRVVSGLAGPGASILDAVSRLAAAMAAMTQPVALVLDHLELLENQECLDVVAELAAQLPTGSRLLLASRSRPPLPVGLLRTQGRADARRSSGRPRRQTEMDVQGTLPPDRVAVITRFG